MSDPVQEPRIPGGTKRNLIHLAKIALSLGIVAYLVHITDIDNILRAAAQVPLSALLATFALNMAASVVVQAMANKVSLDPRTSPTVYQLTKDNLGIQFYTLFLPAGLTFVIRWRKYNARGYNGFISAAQVILHKILQVWTSALFMLVSVLALAVYLAARYESFLLVAMAFFAAATLALAYFLFPRGGRIVGLLEGTMLRVAGRLKAVGRVYQRLHGASEEVSRIPARHKLLLIVLALLQQGLIIAGAYVILEGLGADAPVMAVAFVRSVVVVLMLVPISIAGIGLRELSFYGLLPMFGVSKDIAVTASLLLLANSIVMGLVGAVSEVAEMLEKRPRA